MYTSNASTITRALVAAALRRPVAVMVSVWLVSASALAEKTAAWYVALAA